MCEEAVSFVFRALLSTAVGACLWLLVGALMGYFWIHFNAAVLVVVTATNVRRKTTNTQVQGPPRIYVLMLAVHLKPQRGVGTEGRE